MPSQQKQKLGLEDLKSVLPNAASQKSDAGSDKHHTKVEEKNEEIETVVPVTTSVPQSAPISSKQVLKRDGTRAPFNADHINRSIEKATYGIPNPLEKVMQIATETELTIYDGITTEEMDQATINAALQNAQYDLDYDKIATRLLLKTIYKNVLGTFDTKEEEIIA